MSVCVSGKKLFKIASSRVARAFKDIKLNEKQPTESYWNVYVLIVNYPMRTAVRGDSLNVSMYPDPSSSPYEGSGLRVVCDMIWYKRTSDYSDGSHASCMHSIKNIRLQ